MTKYYEVVTLFGYILYIWEKIYDCMKIFKITQINSIKIDNRIIAFKLLLHIYFYKLKKIFLFEIYGAVTISKNSYI